MQEIHISMREIQISMQEIRNGDNSQHQETMIWENTSPIHGPLPMIIFFNLILARGQAARLF